MPTTVASKKLQQRSAHWRDYLELTKPRVVALLLLTAVVGMALAQTEWVALDVLIPALAGIGLMSLPPLTTWSIVISMQKWHVRCVAPCRKAIYRR